MSKVIALIPARSGSKGVKDKNIRNLGGYPLLAWSILACKKCALIDKVIVSTDSEKYASIARKFGAEVPFLRPPEISSDLSTDLEFIDHAIKKMESANEIPEYIAHIRPTSPLRDPNILKIAIELFVADKGASALRSVHKMSESAFKSFEITSHGVLKGFGVDDTNIDGSNSARQIYPETYVANGYIDVLSVDFIRERGLLHGSRVKPMITPVINEVDTEEDFMFLEYQVATNPSFSSLFLRRD